MLFKAELKQINGIGDKVLEDILAVYPTKEDLFLAIQKGSKLPFDNDIEKKLIYTFRDRIKAEKKQIISEDEVYIKSSQGYILVSRSFNPGFKLHFKDKPLLVKKEVAQYLVDTFPNRFRLLKKTKGD